MHRRDGFERDRLAAVGRIDVEIFQVRHAGALTAIKTSHDWDLLIAFQQSCDPIAAQVGGGRCGDIFIGNPGQVGAIGIDFESRDHRLPEPIVANPARIRNGAQNFST